MLFYISGMLAANVSDGAKIYFDASEYPDVAKQKVVQLMIGHSGWSQGYEMDKVEGYDNIYLVTMPKWDGCTEFCFFGADALWGGESQKMGNRLQWMPAHTDVIAISSNVSGSVGFGGNPLKRTDSYQLPVKAPVITIGAAPEFATTTVGETSKATVTYTVENSEEKPEISLDNDAFTAEDAGGTITITFAPTEAKEYTATLTIAIGDIKETVDLVATGVAADAPKVPEILNLKAGEISAIYVGETTEFEVTYKLANAEEATASIEGEGFTIKKQEVGTATIEFAPTEAKTYEAVVTITSGETTQTLEISATATNAPTKIIITYVNTEGYENVYVHAWGGTASATDWPGQQLTATGNQINGYDTYSFIFEEGAYTQCLFNCGGENPDACKTGDQTIDVAKTYFYGGLWYATEEEIPAEIADVWTVVGVEGLFETAWDFGNVAYDMTEGEAGIYTLVIDEVALDATDYTYKFVQNRSWSGAQYPQVGDYTLTVAEAASYKVTYTLDTKAGNGTCAIEKISTPIPEPKPSLTVSAEEVVFDELTLGDEPVSATATITYTIENSDETAVVALESEVFEAIDEDGTITITFAPEAEGEYTAELTITLGEIVKTIAISGSAKAAEIIEPEKPELIVSTEEVVFETLILDGEQFSSTETITYEIRNSDEAAVIALESEVFEAEDENGTITITFTPIFRNASYKATLTITLGDIVKTVAISAVVKPLIDDLIYPGFDDTKVGEYEEIEMLYSLHKGNEGVARIEGDPAFEITSQEVGRMFIKFTPLEAKEYTATLIITSGKFERELTLTANGLAPDPEPTDITFTVQVPEGTKECYIAGTSDDEDLAWKFIQMEKVDGEENLFSITVEKTVLDGKQWKYASGADWQYAEVIEGNGNRTEAGDPYDVVTAWQKLYDPDFQPIDPYYAIRGLNGDASWTGSGDIKLEESADASEWVALGFTVAEGESFKVIYIDENAKVSGYYAGLEEGCEIGQTYDDNGNLVLPAGTYNLYFKPNTELMWISKVDTPTDAEEAIAELIYAVDGTIIAPAPFAIIDLSGKDVTKANGSLQGTYIVKTLNSVTKVSVQ